MSNKVSIYFVSRFKENGVHYDALGSFLASDLSHSIGRRSTAVFISGYPDEVSGSRKRSAQLNFKHMRVNQGNGIRFTESCLFPSGDTLNWRPKKKREYILKSDMIVLLGGCPHRTMEVMQEQELYETFMQYIGERDNGVVFGVSGGMAAMSEYAITPKSGKVYPETRVEFGYNLIKGISGFPHVDVIDGQIPAFTETTDGIFEAGELIRVATKSGPYLLFPNNSVIRVRDSMYNVIGRSPYILTPNGSLSRIDQEGSIEAIRKRIKQL